jgi:hypothetical protein
VVIHHRSIFTPHLTSSLHFPRPLFLVPQRGGAATAQSDLAAAAERWERSQSPSTAVMLAGGTITAQGALANGSRRNATAGATAPPSHGTAGTKAQVSLSLGIEWSGGLGNHMRRQISSSERFQKSSRIFATHITKTFRVESKRHFFKPRIQENARNIWSPPCLFFDFVF